MNQYIIANTTGSKANNLILITPSEYGLMEVRKGMIMTRILCSIVMLVLIVGGPARAAEPGAAAMKALESKETSLLKGISPTGQDQFQKIRTAHGTLRAVDDVRAALDRAVKNCAKHHKDQAFSFENTFQSWKNAVLPVMRQGQNRLDKMVLTQTFAKPADVRAYLTAYTAAIAAQHAGVTEVPVSDLDACQAMVKSMADTQKTMAGMIKETLGIE